MSNVLAFLGGLTNQVGDQIAGERKHNRELEDQEFDYMIRAHQEMANKALENGDVDTYATAMDAMQKYMGPNARTKGKGMAGFMGKGGGLPQSPLLQMMGGMSSQLGGATPPSGGGGSTTTEPINAGPPPPQSAPFSAPNALPNSIMPGMAGAGSPFAGLDFSIGPHDLKMGLQDQGYEDPARFAPMGGELPPTTSQPPAEGASPLHTLIGTQPSTQGKKRPFSGTFMTPYEKQLEFTAGQTAGAIKGKFSGINDVLNDPNFQKLDPETQEWFKDDILSRQSNTTRAAGQYYDPATKRTGTGYQETHGEHAGEVYMSFEDGTKGWIKGAVKYINPQNFVGTYGNITSVGPMSAPANLGNYGTNQAALMGAVTTIMVPDPMNPGQMVAVQVPVSRVGGPMTPVGPAAGAPQSTANLTQQAADAMYTDVIRQLGVLRMGSGLMMMNPDKAAAASQPFVIVTEAQIDQAADDYAKRTYGTAWQDIKRARAQGKETPATSGTTPIGKGLTPPPTGTLPTTPDAGAAARLAELKAAAPSSRRFAEWKASLPKPPTQAEIDTWIDQAAQAIIETERRQATKK